MYIFACLLKRNYNDKEDNLFRNSTETFLGEESYPEALEQVEKNPHKFKAQFPSFFDRAKNWLSETITSLYMRFLSFFI